MMKQSDAQLGRIALILSLIVLVAFIVVLFNMKTIGPSLEYTSILIGALGLITAVLIGFQIVNIVQLDKRFELYENKTYAKIEKSLLEQKKEISNAAHMAEYAAIGTSLMMLSWSFIEKGEIDDAMRALINSLRAFQQAGVNNPDIQDDMHEVEDALISIAKSNRKEWMFKNIDEKNVFIDTAMKVQDRDKMNKLLDFFYSFSILERD